MDIEERIFQLLGLQKRAPEIIDTVMAEFGVDADTAMEVACKVIGERGTPKLEAARHATERLGRVRFI
jgi:hypothetical protein